MKIATIIARVLLGLCFVTFGLNAFLNFIPMKPDQMPTGLAGDFAGAMMKSHYMQAVAVFEIAGGVLLLIGSYVPLGLILVGPVVVNILMFHIFLEPKGLPIAAVVGVLSLFLLVRYRSAFAGLVKH